MMASEKCPGCGAEMARVNCGMVKIEWQCRSMRLGGGTFLVHQDCLVRQLSQAKAEIALLQTKERIAGRVIQGHGAEIGRLNKLLDRAYSASQAKIVTCQRIRHERNRLEGEIAELRATLAQLTDKLQIRMDHQACSVCGNKRTGEECVWCDRERLRGIVDPLNRLREAEGSYVTIAFPNPDFMGPNQIIWVESQGSKPQRFEGDTLAECLSKAEAAEKAREDGG